MSLEVRPIGMALVIGKLQALHELRDRLTIGPDDRLVSQNNARRDPVVGEPAPHIVELKHVAPTGQQSSIENERPLPFIQRPSVVLKPLQLPTNIFLVLDVALESGEGPLL